MNIFDPLVVPKRRHLMKKQLLQNLNCHYTQSSSLLIINYDVINWILLIFRNMICSLAGITSDANVLTNELRVISQRYLLQYGETIPCEQLVSWLCDIKQAYTQYGGKYSQRSS